MSGDYYIVDSLKIEKVENGFIVIYPDGSQYVYASRKALLKALKKVIV